jgi:hypothetical protein
MRPYGVSAARQKKGIFARPGKSWAIACEVAHRRNRLKKMQRVSAGPINDISLPARNFAAAIPERGREDYSCSEVLITTS